MGKHGKRLGKRARQTALASCRRPLAAARACCFNENEVHELIAIVVDPASASLVPIVVRRILVNGSEHRSPDWMAVAFITAPSSLADARFPRHGVISDL